MKKQTEKILRISASGILICLGIAGLLLPLLPGIPILLAGLYLINPKKFKRGFQKVKSKFNRK